MKLGVKKKAWLFVTLPGGEEEKGGVETKEEEYRFKKRLKDTRIQFPLFYGLTWRIRIRVIVIMSCKYNLGL